MGPQLVVKSLALIWRNLGPALRATAVPLGIGFALAAALAWIVGGPTVFDGVSLVPVDPFVPGEDAVPEGPVVSGPEAGRAAVGILLAVLPAAFGLLWAAVAWHRFVLLEEVPGLVPPLHGDRVGAYLWGWVRLIGPLILVGVVIAVLAAAAVAAAAALGAPPLAVLFLFGINVLAAYAIMRFSLVLPAAAVGRSMGVFESWGRTKGARDAILIAAALLSVLNAVIGLAGGALGLAGWPGTVLSLAFSWFGFVLGLSILTAIYGHVVEGRPLE